MSLIDGSFLIIGLNVTDDPNFCNKLSWMGPVDLSVSSSSSELRVRMTVSSWLLLLVAGFFLTTMASLVPVIFCIFKFQGVDSIRKIITYTYTVKAAESTVNSNLVQFFLYDNYDRYIRII